MLPSDTLLNIKTPIEDQNDDKTVICTNNIKESIESLPKISPIKYETQEILGQNDNSKFDINPSLEHSNSFISQDDETLPDDNSTKNLLLIEENGFKIEEPEIQQISLNVKPKSGEMSVSNTYDSYNEDNKILKLNLEKTPNESNILLTKSDTIDSSSSILQDNKTDKILLENKPILENMDTCIKQCKNDNDKENLNVFSPTSNELQARDVILENVSPSLPIEITASVKQKCPNDILKPFEEDINENEEGHLAYGKKLLFML